MTTEQMRAELSRLQAENAALKAKPTKTLSLKVSEKGGISIYGMGRFPVTLYVSQWEQVFATQEKIKAFILANAQVIASKQAQQAQAPSQVAV